MGTTTLLDSPPRDGVGLGGILFDTPDDGGLLSAVLVGVDDVDAVLLAGVLAPGRSCIAASARMVAMFCGKTILELAAEGEALPPDEARPANFAAMLSTVEILFLVVSWLGLDVVVPLCCGDRGVRGGVGG